MDENKTFLDSSNSELSSSEPILTEQHEEENEETIYEEVEPKYEEVKVEKKYQEKRTDSYFDGKLLELIGWNILSCLITIVTFGIAAPWGKCMLLKFEIEHTVINGKRLKFIGNGGNLFVEQFKWIFFTIITLGIYAFWIPIKRTKWVVSNIHFEDEQFVRGESYFDGKLLGLIGINILTNFLNLISFGLLFTFTICIRLNWYAKHTVINRKKVVFEGSGLALLGKYLLWAFLTIITFGIYGLWLTIKIKKWEVKNTRLKLAGEVEKKNKTTIILVICALIFTIPFIFLINTVTNTIINNIDFENFNLGGDSMQMVQQQEVLNSYYDYNY